MYTVYALYNRKARKIYIGQTDDKDKRLKQHNNPNDFLSKYTKKYKGRWRLYTLNKLTHGEKRCKEKNS